jgi:hypothetical protein
MQSKRTAVVEKRNKRMDRIEEEEDVLGSNY